MHYANYVLLNKQENQVVRQSPFKSNHQPSNING